MSRSADLCGPNARRDSTLALGFVAALAISALGISTLPPRSAASAGAPPGTPRAVASTISAGGIHSCAILANGELLCWGYGLDGRLGYGDTQARGDQPNEMGSNLPPVDLGTGRTARSVVTGTSHTCALLDNATVKCWGNNGSGRLGYGDTLTRYAPPTAALNLGSGRTATAIAAGAQHTCALLDDATVKCWGANGSGQLGYGDTQARGDQQNEMGNALPAVQLGAGRTVTAIAAGGATTCAILDDRSVACWGANSSGQLGYGDTQARGDQQNEMGAQLPRVPLGAGRHAVAIDVGGSHVCAVLDDGSAKCWGENAAGQLGRGSTADIGDGPGEMGDALTPIQLGTNRTAVSISAGAEHTCAVLDTGSAVCWGANADGQLGRGNTFVIGDGPGEMGNALVAVPLGEGRTVRAIALGQAHSCARLDDLTLKCWGRGGFGRLGTGSTESLGDQLPEMLALAAIDLGDRPRSIVNGPNHTCAILGNGTLKCWGDGDDGRLGYGDTTSRGDGLGEMGDALPAVDLGAGRTATAVALGTSFTCALLDNGRVKCWGANTLGQLGYGDTTARLAPPVASVDLGFQIVNTRPVARTAVAIAAAGAHACAILSNGAVKCWGSNFDGRLGYGDTDNRGDGPGEMSENLPTVDLGSGRTATAIDLGPSHSCALLDNATVKCWGSGAFGKLGYGDTTNRGDGPGEMGNNLPTIALGTGRTARAISAGGIHTCAVLDNFRLKCWGANAQGQLGYGDTNVRGDGPGEMGDSLPLVDLGTLPSNATPYAVVAVAAGGNHTCAVLSVAFSPTGIVKCWGINTSGQLGYGDTSNRGTTSGQMGTALPAVALGTGRTATAISADNSTTCVRLDLGSLSCWGANARGQLGYGDTSTRGDGPDEMGESLPRIDVGGRPWLLLTPAGTPASPSAPAATAGVGSATVSWTAPTDDGGAKVTGYRIQGSTDNGAVWTTLVANTGTTATARSITGLTGGQVIRFRVAAINTSGAGVVSLASNPVTPSAPPTAGTVRFVPLAPLRILDTRPDGITTDAQFQRGGIRPANSTLEIQVTGRAGVPTTATAVVVNITATQAQANGFVTVHPCGTPPNASNLNYQPGISIPNSVTTKLSPRGTICLTTNRTVHLIADINGYHP
jgi:alpha-tubulin suppressor-like RCC1 family protein